MQHPGYKKSLWEKTVENLSSVKVYILIMASVFLAVGKIDGREWVETVLIIGGFRMATDITSIVKTKNDGG